jgi:hypothetical protein
MAAVRRFLYSLVLIAIFPCFLTAQDFLYDELGNRIDGESGTHVTKTDEGLQLSQIITFPAVPNALYYEVEIEGLEGNTFVPLDRIRTETNSMELSLKAGSYRYRITSYDTMNILDGRSNWQDFLILPAEQPEVENYQPFYGLYYELADPSGSIVVTGQALYEESEFALVVNNGDWSNINLDNRKGVLLADEVTVSADHTQAEISFTRSKIKRGVYYIFVRNPGGLWTLLGQVRVGYRKNTDFTFSLSYSPMIAFFDYEKSHKGDNLQRLNRFNMGGAVLRFGWIPVKTRIGNFGLEANFEFLADNSYRSSSDNPFEALQGGHVDLLYQRVLNEQWQLNLRIGVGGGEEYDDDNDNHDEDEDEDVIPLLLNFGVSAQYFIWKNLYLEAGINFQYMRAVEHTMFRPTLGLGWQFGRLSEYAEITKQQRKGIDPSVPVTGMILSESTLSLGWAPMIPVFGISKTHEGTTTLRSFNPGGGYIRAAYLPYRWGKNKLGMELNTYILEHPNRLDYVEDDSVERYLELLSTVHLGVLYQYVFKEPWQFNVRAGVGISNPYDFDEGHDDKGYTIPVSASLGSSIQYFIKRNFYAEAGLDFTISFGEYRNHGILRPGLGIGWQFNRNAETGIKPNGGADTDAGEKAPWVPRLGLSAGAGGFFHAGLGGGSEGHSGMTGSFSNSYTTVGGGGFIFFDATYVELALGFSGGSLSFEGEYELIPNEEATTSYTAIDISLLGKLPFSLGRFTLFPLAGFDFQYFLSSFIDEDIVEHSSHLNTWWFNLGAGLDFALTKNLYLRAEALYGIRFHTRWENDSMNFFTTDMNINQGHGPTIKIGLGYRFNPNAATGIRLNRRAAASTVPAAADSGTPEETEVPE